MKEVEAKYAVKSFTPIKQKLKNLGFTNFGEKEYTDYYYTDKDWKFIKNETCLRLRKYKDKTVFTYKPRTIKNTGLKSKTEIETIVDFKNMDKILKSLGYPQAVSFHKKSEYYKKGKTTVSLDTVGGKKYVEIEVLTNDTKKAKEEIKKVSEQLSVSRLEMRNFRDIMLGYNRYLTKKK